MSLNVHAKFRTNRMGGYVWVPQCLENPWFFGTPTFISLAQDGRSKIGQVTLSEKVFSFI